MRLRRLICALFSHRLNTVGATLEHRRLCCSRCGVTVHQRRVFGRWITTTICQDDGGPRL